jgi:hypothetical protein
MCNVLLLRLLLSILPITQEHRLAAYTNVVIAPAGYPGLLPATHNEHWLASQAFHSQGGKLQMAQTAPSKRRVDSTPTLEATLAETASASEQDKDKILPLPSWLVKVYFIFPVVLYIPDAIFNFFVYSDGATGRSTNPVIEAGFTVLWGFLALGVVGMAYLLSVLAPWHWGQGHRVQAFFCAVGVLVATAITTWCSLAFRSQSFKGFVTDQWVYSVWPQLRATHFSLTMLLVAIAPPFWGLFWAVVQPTATRRSLRQLQESHEERMLRMKQEAEIKALRADANAKVREAQLRGMAATAVAARKQAAQFISQRKATSEEIEGDTGDPINLLSAPADDVAVSGESAAQATGLHAVDQGSRDDESSDVFSLPPLTSRHGSDMSIMNHAAGSASAAHAAPTVRSGRLQPVLITEADVEGTLGIPQSGDAVGFAPRRPPMLGGGLTPAINPMLDAADVDGMTGTTGPRPALRRSGQISTLVSNMNGANPAQLQIVTEAMRELNIPLPVNRKSLTAAQMRTLVPRVAAKLDTADEAFARGVITRVLKSDTNRGN